MAEERPPVPSPYAGSHASGSPHALPHPISWKAQPFPLGPWASRGVHSLSPAEPGDKLPVCAPWGYGSFAHARGPTRLTQDRSSGWLCHGARPRRVLGEGDQGFTPRPGCLPAPPPRRSSPSRPQGTVLAPTPVPARRPPQVSCPPPWQQGRQGWGRLGHWAKVMLPDL